MCGIAGYIGKNKIDSFIIDKTLSLMKNRGPDFRDYRVFQAGDNNIYLLHSRLSIIDLDKRSNQPFTIGDCTIVFNGEIYNYVELKKEMENDGVNFLTSSDTEVLLRYYIKYGEDCVKYFEGMWSFAIYDNRLKKVFFSRDRFAEKPLYFMQENDGLYFGSEVKFIKSLSQRSLTPNYQHLMRYLVNGYKSLYKVEDTFFNEIFELKYAQNMIMDSNLSIKKYRYWTPETKINDKLTLNEAIEHTRYLLLQSMKIRLRADVPLAFCLSGGVDSSALASIAAKEFGYDVASFSIVDSDERYNEYDNIKATIDDIGCKNTIIHLSYENTFQDLKELITYHDAPIYTITYLVHSYLSRAINNNGYKIAFSGTSADELFTGYYDHFNLHLYEMRNHPDYKKYLEDWKNNIGKFVRNPYFKNPELYFENPNIRDQIYLNNDIFSDLLKKEFNEGFFEENFTGSLLRNRMLNELFHEATPVVLHEDDLNSMKYSVENRSPFLDSNLFKFAYSIPNEFLIQNGYGKYVLREALNGILNDQVRLDRRKKGFNASIQSLIDFNNPDQIAYLLEDSPVFDLFDKEKVSRILKMQEISNSYSKFIFNFINVKLFLELDF
ncbi:MAG: hypothetical protein ACD_79C00261G0004 [uncultured bacterium]|nr:MAG: hypothetical protein ACD_79C00261G0004 [uncultured bacterium]